MSTERRALAISPLLLALTACETAFVDPNASEFGDANRLTLAAQVIDPDPQYDTLNPVTSGEHAGQAAERYRKDTVKQPERVRSTESGGGGGPGS